MNPIEESKKSSGSIVTVATLPISFPNDLVITNTTKKSRKPSKPDLSGFKTNFWKVDFDVTNIFPPL